MRRPNALTLLLLFAWTLAGGIETAPAVTEAAQRGVSATLGELSGSFRTLSERVRGAVVQIVVSGYAPAAVDDETGGTTVVAQRSAGSGVIMDPAGFILTNAHVIAGARFIEVQLTVPADERAQWRSILKPRGKMVPAQVVGIDRETDLAVLKVEVRGLTALEFGDSDALRQGDLVLAFGSPLGLDNSVSLGVVSSEARQLRPEDPMIYIQTDASINPGNSGGPLVNTEGRVVGINTFILSQSGGSEGLGFAAPSSIARTVFDQLRRDGRVRRGLIGVHAQTVTESLALGLGLHQSWGVVLADVFPGSPGERAGMQVGDLVVTLDGKTMENARQFDVNLYQRRVGDSVTLEYYRGADKRSARVLVVERDDDPHRFADRVIGEKNLVPQLGVFAMALNADVAALLPGVRKRSGVLVAARAGESSHLGEMIQPGDVIYAINREPVDSLESLKAMLDKLSDGKPLVMQLERTGRLQYVEFRLP